MSALIYVIIYQEVSFINKEVELIKKHTFDNIYQKNIIKNVREGGNYHFMWIKI